MDLKIDFDEHAARRILARSEAFGIDCDEAKRCIIETIESRNLAAKHCSRKFTTYSRYFSNGLTFYVVCSEKTEKTSGKILQVMVKTIIIEYGR